jgi:hypothetical protein
MPEQNLHRAGCQFPCRSTMPLFGAATELLVRFVQAKADGDLPEVADTLALARLLSTVASAMGVIASSEANREALREVARVSLGPIARSGKD